MARRGGTAIYRAVPAGARRTSRKMTDAARELRANLEAELSAHVQPEVEAIFVDSAPYDYDERDDTHLAEELTVDVDVGSRVELTVDSPVRDPRSGYAYTGVTRFGHRGVLRPRLAPMLRWKDGAGWHSAPETRGYHPSGDWVEAAAVEADREVERAADRLGRVIATQVLS